MSKDAEAAYRQQNANLMGEVERLTIQCAELKREAQWMARAMRLRVRMEDELMVALEPLRQAAQAAGAEKAPDDAVVSVSMGDCRKAALALSPRSREWEDAVE